MEDVKTWMIINETDPKVQQVLLAGIKAWIGIVEWTKMGKPRRGERELERWKRRQESIGDGDVPDSQS